VASRTRSGAYGLHLVGLHDPALVPAGTDWPTVRIERSIGRTTASEDAVGEQRARLLLRNGGEIALERSPLRALFRVPLALGDAELVHPYLAPAAAAIGWWLGRESFHGGGIVVDGSAIGIFGDRHAGKSSLLAALAQGGEPVLSDDVLVVDPDLATFAGPRTVDPAEARRSTSASAVISASSARGNAGAWTSTRRSSRRHCAPGSRSRGEPRWR
jgi:hypothetical protein